MIASSSATTTRGRRVGASAPKSTGSAGREIGGDAIEQLILLRLELAHVLAQGVAVAGERIGVPAGVAGLDVRERRLGDERAQAYVVGLLLEEHQLLLGDG